MKLFINGGDELISKDKFGCKLKYKKCYHYKSRKFFLMIQSRVQHLFGVSDLWDSDDSDVLTIATDDGDMVYIYQDDRFWLQIDGVENNKILAQFEKIYPEAHLPQITGEEITGIFGNTINHFTFDDKKKNGKYKFTLVKEVGIQFNHDTTQEEDEDDNVTNAKAPKSDNIQPKEEPVKSEITKSNKTSNEEETSEATCELVCHYNSNGLCTYYDNDVFDGNNDVLIAHETTCESPILHLEGN